MDEEYEMTGKIEVGNITILVQTYNIKNYLQSKTTPTTKRKERESKLYPPLSIISVMKAGR